MTSPFPFPSSSSPPSSSPSSSSCLLLFFLFFFAVFFCSSQCCLDPDSKVPIKMNFTNLAIHSAGSSSRVPVKMAGVMLVAPSRAACPEHRSTCRSPTHLKRSSGCLQGAQTTGRTTFWGPKQLGAHGMPWSSCKNP